MRNQSDELLKVLHDCYQQELVGGTGDPAQSQAAEAQVAFEMGKAHLDLLPLLSRACKRRGCNERTLLLEHVAGHDALPTLGAVFNEQMRQSLVLAT